MRQTPRMQMAELEELPNIGKVIAQYLRKIGIQTPDQLKGRDPYQMFERLAQVSGRPYDPCLLDVFISAVKFMEGGPPCPWWRYTAERKRVLQGKTFQKNRRE
jgi:hypothetical protein